MRSSLTLLCRSLLWDGRVPVHAQTDTGWHKESRAPPVHRHAHDAGARREAGTPGRGPASRRAAVRADRRCRQGRVKPTPAPTAAMKKQDAFTDLVPAPAVEAAQCRIIAGRSRCWRPTPQESRDHSRAEQGLEVREAGLLLSFDQWNADQRRSTNPLRDDRGSKGRRLRACRGVGAQPIIEGDRPSGGHRHGRARNGAFQDPGRKPATNRQGR